MPRARKRQQNPQAIAKRIVDRRIAEALDPEQFLGDADFMIEGSNLIEQLSGRDVLALDEYIAFEKELQKAVPAAMHARYIKLSDSNGAIACAHFNAGFLLGVEIGRAIPKGGQR